LRISGEAENESLPPDAGYGSFNKPLWEVYEEGFKLLSVALHT